MAFIAAFAACDLYLHPSIRWRAPVLEADYSVDCAIDLGGRGLTIVPATTTALAARLAVSLAAVSQHTKVLREMGLLTTSRVGPAVRHGLTPLGHRLLDGRDS